MLIQLLSAYSDGHRSYYDVFIDGKQVDRIAKEIRTGKCGTNHTPPNEFDELSIAVKYVVGRVMGKKLPDPRTVASKIIQPHRLFNAGGNKINDFN